MSDRRSGQGAAAFPLIGWIFSLFALAGCLIISALVVWEFRTGRSAQANGVIAAAGYWSVVQFSTERGEAVRFINSVHADWHVGDSVAVVYDPARPQNAVIDGFLADGSLSDWRLFSPGYFSS